jgi:hypothetical protein
MVIEIARRFALLSQRLVSDLQFEVLLELGGWRLELFLDLDHVTHQVQPGLYSCAEEPMNIYGCCMYFGPGGDRRVAGV